MMYKDYVLYVLLTSVWHIIYIFVVLFVHVATSEDGRFRGFAHIGFSDCLSAARAISTLHEIEFLGRNIRVDACEPRPSRPHGSGGG